MNILDVQPRSGQGLYVYGMPVRLWHWVMAGCIFTLVITGHFIAHPPQSLLGDPSYIFNFGMLIKTHYTAGLILCISMLCRLIWAFFGNPVSRQIFIVPIWQKAWWQGLWANIKWYCFLTKEPETHMGHNPLAQLAMFFIILDIFFMCFSGLGIFQAKQYSPFFETFQFMENFAYALGGNGIDLVVAHVYGTILVICFIIIHVYMVIREGIMGRTTMIYTMISGNRLVVEKPVITEQTLKAQSD